MLNKLKSFIIECKRVLQVTKKPDGTEFMNIFKISGIGVLLIGAIGFLLFIIREMLV
ncbi:MAG: protein translocase SEC61 complex subunit gamma [Nanoarchaeota archaeon]